MKNKLPKGFKVKKQVLKSSKKKYNAIQKFKQVDGEIEAVAKEAMQLMILDTDIEILEEVIEQIQNNLTIKESKLNQLKERKQSLLNNLNTDNNK